MRKSSCRLVAMSLSVSLACSTLVSSSVRAQEAAPPFGKINHFVVIYTENRSLDGLYAQFPGADNLTSASNFPPQVDFDGTVLKTLPRARIRNKVDERFPADLPNAPFAIDPYVSATERTGDLVHKFYQEQEQIDGGRNDRFAAISDAGGLAMGYYKGDTQKLWSVAKGFTLADHFHHAAFGSSFLNHFWLVCACTPVFPNPLANMVAAVDPKTGFLARASNSPKSALDGLPVWISDGAVTPDGYAVNTIQPPYPPYAMDSKPLERLPPQTMPTIGDRLSEKKISWAWYSGGWNAAVLGKIESYEGPDYFQPHHQPFNYFAAYAPGTRARAEHLKDYEDLKEAIASSNLPAVAFYKPVGRENQHPGYATVATGDTHVAELIRLVQQSDNWKDTAIIVTADENGGAWDSVPPPHVDRWGPGLRVPTLIVSPYAKRGFVDHTVYDTTSILKTIELRYGLAPLSTRDAAVADLGNAFDFAKGP
jgi:acid phosphatase